MDVVVGKRWEEFVSNLVAGGRYGSSEEVVEAGLSLVQENEAKLEALRDMVRRSIEEGGSCTPEEVTAALDAAYAEAKAQGY